MTAQSYLCRQSTTSDVSNMVSVCKLVYPDSPAWATEQLLSHQKVFPQGQLVVEDIQTKEIVGFASSLIVDWDDYEWNTSWRDFTAGGCFTNHDPQNGRTLYGAEIMVLPSRQGTGAGSVLYRAREELVQNLGLLRIRAGARLRGYHKYAETMTPEEYTLAVVKGQIIDPTLSFQIKRKFNVLRVIGGYLKYDPESLGNAAVIEWINKDVAKPEHYAPLLRSKFVVSAP